METAVTLNARTGSRPGADLAQSAHSTAQAFAHADSSRLQERRGDIPLTENPAYRQALYRRSDPAATETEGFDGRQLRNSQAELRALRADVAELARALGRPLTSQSTLTEYRGVLQQFDELDSDVQRSHFDRDAQHASSPRAELAAELREGEARMLLRKQEQLLAALRRAERRLEDAPEQVLPPGVREAVIGEILRARHSAALFGGAVPLAFTGRLTSSVV
jgi:hypothetical protein